MFDSAESVRFADLIDLGLLDVGDGYRAKLEELGEGGPLFLRAGALTDRGFVWQGLDRFEPNASVGNKLGFPEDVVMTTKGNSIGRAGYVPDNAPAFVYSPHLSYWRSLNKEKLLPRYLYYWSRSPEFKSQLRTLGFGTDMAPYLSLRDQLRVQIQLPASFKQRAISDVLGALDDKIAANSASVQSCRDLALLLGSHASHTVKLSEIVRVSKTSRAPEDMVTDSVWHYSLPAFDQDEQPSHVRTIGIKSAKFVINEPCVLISKLNPRFPRVWNVPMLHPGESVASTEFVVLSPAVCSTGMLSALLSQRSFGLVLEGKVSGTSGSHQRVRPADLLATDVGDPRSVPEAVQAQVTGLCDLVYQLGEESRRLADLRDTLLPHLMSGRLRVRDAEMQVGEVV